MSGSDDNQFYGGDDVFDTFVALVVRKPLCRPRQMYEQLFRRLRSVLWNATSEELDLIIANFIKFGNTSHAWMDAQLYMEFMNMCTNTILHWVFARRTSAEVVRKLMEIVFYTQNQTNNLALAWRRFTPIYNPLGGLTPLMFAAQHRRFDVLKVLLQIGMLERERRPSYIIIPILFDLPHPEELEHICLSVRECMALCFRVLTHVSVADFEIYIMHGETPLITDWRDHIPPNRCRDPCELSHLCRAALRRTLLVVGLLPDGIRSLPLPPSLQGYLNLES